MRNVFYMLRHLVSLQLVPLFEELQGVWPCWGKNVMEDGLWEVHGFILLLVHSLY